MMRSKKSIWLGLILTVAMVAPSQVVAQGDGNGWGGAWARGEHPRMERFHEERFERVSAFLDLNDQQMKQWREAFEARGAERPRGGEEMRALHEEIQGLASAAEPDATAVGELVIQAHRLMAAHEAEREGFHAELMSILTPEQQERFEALQELRPEMGPAGPGGPRGSHSPHGRHFLRPGGPAGGAS